MPFLNLCFVQIFIAPDWFFFVSFSVFISSKIETEKLTKNKKEIYKLCLKVKDEKNI